MLTFLQIQKLGRLREIHIIKDLSGVVLQESFVSENQMTNMCHYINGLIKENTISVTHRGKISVSSLKLDHFIKSVP